MSFERKMKRNKLKQQLGTNKIKQAFHEQFETLEQKMKREHEEKERKNEIKQQNLF